MPEQTSNQSPSGFKTLFQNKYFKRYFFVSSLFTAAAIVILLSVFLNRENFSGELEKTRQEFQDLKSEINMMAKIMEYDELVIVEGEYEEALEYYRQLLPKLSVNQKAMVERRISEIESLIEQRDNSDDSNPFELLAQKNRKIIEHLEFELDSLDSLYSVRIDSMDFLISDLESEISDKEQKIRQKERIRVITFNSPKGHKIHYLGEVSDEKANGGGVGIWTTGSVYKGKWKDNLRHGEGVFEWKDGEKYEGEYVDGQRQGQGTYHWPSGERYEGEWKEDRRNGFGKLYDQDGNIRFEGEWKNDKPVRD